MGKSMGRRWWASVPWALLVACGGGGSAEGPPGPRGAVSPLVQDLGEVWEGRSATCEFQIHNQGTEPLVLKRIRAACACVVAELTVREIPPGGSITLPVEFQSLYKFGPNDRQLTVFTNDPVTPQLVLRVRAQVTRLLELDPPVLDLGQAWSAEEARGALVVRSRDGQDFEILHLDSPDPAVLLEWHRLEADVPSWRVQARLAPDAPADWSAQVPVLAEVKHPVHSRFKIPLAGALLAPVVVEPPERLDLGTYGARGAATGEIHVRARDPNRPCPSVRATLAAEANLLVKGANGLHRQFASVEVLPSLDGAATTLKIQVEGDLPLPRFAGLVQIFIGAEDRPSHTVLVNAVREEVP